MADLKQVSTLSIGEPTQKAMIACTIFKKQSTSGCRGEKRQPGVTLLGQSSQMTGVFALPAISGRSACETCLSCTTCTLFTKSVFCQISLSKVGLPKAAFFTGTRLQPGS
jgi:hypothetical protein